MAATTATYTVDLTGATTRRRSLDLNIGKLTDTAARTNAFTNSHGTAGRHRC